MSTRIGMCLVTGARVLFREYGFVVSADLFQVGDCVVLRTNPGTRLYEPSWLSRATHVVDLGNDGFFNEDAGVAVVVAERLRELQR